MSVRLRFLGTGDAFGSGGRFQACILVEADDGRVLLDCGASSLIALKRAGIDPNTIDAIAVSHYHGDHFGGIPFFVLDGHFGKRDRELVIAGPADVAARIDGAVDALYPGYRTRGALASGKARPFEIRFVDLADGVPTAVGPARVTALPVDHTADTAPHGLRVELGGRVVAYSGDTAWTDTLLELARGSDAFICEAYTALKDVPKHLNIRALVGGAARFGTQRLILTHFGPDMLEIGSVSWATLAHDGLVVTLDGPIGGRSYVRPL